MSSFVCLLELKSRQNFEFLAHPMEKGGLSLPNLYGETFFPPAKDFTYYFSLTHHSALWYGLYIFPSPNVVNMSFLVCL